MSANNDNVFARWSRRKLAVRANDSQAPNDEKQARDVPVEQEGACSQPAAPESGAAEAETEEPAEPLPRIEDLTAESDLAAFLRKGVPNALKSAAIRRMWTLDPSIRHHVGLAEYAWDFNQPGSMAGFGPLDPEEAAVHFLSKIGHAIDTGADEEERAADAPPAQQPQEPAASSEQQQNTLQESTDPSSQDESSSAQPLSPSSQFPAQGRIEAAASQTERDERAPASRSAARPRHGSALPR